MSDLCYLSGFNNQFSSEAIAGSLPVGQNSPQSCPFGLYAEQLSGTAFTMPRSCNQRSWLYRLYPSIGHGPFEPLPSHALPLLSELTDTPNQLRWDPFAIPDLQQDGPVDFVHGLNLIAGSGSPKLKNGLSIYIYAANASMESSSFFNSDGDFLIVPQEGTLDVQTEFGKLRVAPNEILVIPRGIKFCVRLLDGAAVRGYILEVFNGHFEIPDLGLIGANGLANPRDFLYPVAHFEQSDAKWQIVTKFAERLFVATQNHSPFDVVAWHGNYAPYKYDLANFNAMNTVTFDHADPSIFTVLTCKSAISGLAVADFVIFPPRWTVADHTFRPPYYHRNVMSEFMGNIKGTYEAKPTGFQPGGASLHNVLSAHGPDRATFEQAHQAPLAPQRVADGCMSFMFESSLALSVNPSMLARSQADYWKVWQGLKSYFSSGRK